MDRLGGKEEFKERVRNLIIISEDARDNLDFVNKDIADILNTKEILYSDIKGDEESLELLAKLETILCEIVNCTIEA